MPGLESLAIQLLNGLSHATTLFLMAAGLTLIFGVTRVVNFAHGSFFMLGALVAAHAVTYWFDVHGASAWGYLLAMLAGTVVAAIAGALMQLLILRRMRGVPHLYPLLATFGLTLVMHDAMQAVFGVEEVFAPRFPGLEGALALGDAFFPTWQLLTMALGPLVWWGLHALLKHSLWGQRVRAATQDAAMLSALGVRPGPLMLGVVVLGCALAGLAGALQLPREPANLQMDMQMVVETFVVVVTGGLGSIGGAYGAAVLIGLIHAFGVTFFPQATLVLVFLTMAVVLIWRPQGLARTRMTQDPVEEAQVFELRPSSTWGQALWIGGVLALSMWSWWQGGDYGRSLFEDVLVLMLFGWSLQLMMALGGMVSFGHAAFFALGAYAAALGHLHGAWSWLLAWPAGGVVAAGFAAVFGVLLRRSSGVYWAMLSLALAQSVWALAAQWTELTGGDNGLIGLQLVTADNRGWIDLVLLVLALCSIGLMHRWVRSSMGSGLQALRDAPLRAQASGLRIQRMRYQVFVLSAAVAGVAGAMFASFKGAVFPAVAAVSTSVDALLVILLGGIHQWAGAWLGSALLTFTSSELSQTLTYWRGLLGALIVLVMLLAPQGLMGLRLGRVFDRRTHD
ncbi:MAG: High-affinity branched-chain amino acid transport system permease protein LivH [Pseudomonadota bacterium]